MRQDVMGLVAMVGVAVLACISFAFAGGLIAVAIIEWAGGCGQVIHHADGSQRLGECVVMTWLNDRGY